MKPKNPVSPRKTARPSAGTSASAKPATKAKAASPAKTTVAKAKAKAPSTTSASAPAPVAKAKVPAAAAVPSAAPIAKAKAPAVTAVPVATPVAKAKAPVATPSPAAAPAAKAKVPASTPAPATAPAAKTKAPMAAAVSAAPKAKEPAKSHDLKIPPILLEGDAPAAPAPGGSGQRYALGPKTQTQPVAPAAVELPEAYGTQQLFLTARDPHWLYAHWDMTREQLKKHNSLSADGHLILRVHRDSLTGDPVAQIHLHPESRNWFVPVPDAGAKYLADLGYHSRSRQWVSLTRSGATLTPPDSMSDDTSVRFATIPSEVPFAELLAMVKTAVREHMPLVEALQQLRESGYKNLPSPEQVHAQWTPAQENALAQIVSMDQVRRVWIGSLEITELIRRQLQQHVSSAGVGLFSLPSSALGVAAPSSVSSPFGGAARGRGFWFNVNAELIIYGATEPDATVTIGDRKIQLRPDGSFSYRFALPDGNYSLPAAARSSDGEETRRAGLSFSRSTTYAGDVGAHPQDKNLKPPLVSAVA